MRNTLLGRFLKVPVWLEIALLGTRSLLKPLQEQLTMVVGRTKRGVDMGGQHSLSDYWLLAL